MTKQKCIQAQWELLNGSLESLGAKLTTNVGKQLLKRNIRGALTNYGLDISENFLEEAIVEPISELVAQTAGGKDKANWENMEQRFFKSGIDGAVTSMITGGISGVIGGVASKRQNNQYIDINRNTRLDKNTQNILKQAENIVRETNKLNVKPINPPIQNKNILQSTQPQNKDIGQRLNKLRNIDTSNMGLLEKSKIKTEIRALESGYSSIEEYRNSEEQKKQKALEEYKQKEEYKRLKTKQEELAKKTQIQEQLTNTTPLKRRQYQIIQNTNPMNDDVHVGIRTPTDIKTFNEVINDEESFVWGDYSKEDAKNDLKKGTVTLYSSYPIKNGTFVSTSKQQAIEYAGGNANKVYSKTVPLNEVAWINGDEGQYAKVVANNGKTLYNNNESESGINGEVQREGMDGISGQYDTRVQQESKSKQNYTKTGYEQWEKSIKPSNYITNEQKQIKDNIKNKYGKDIVFFYESNGDYNAGSSLKDKNTIYINPLECKEFGIQKTALHEVIESNIAYYREISDDIIQPTIQQIIQDSNFEKQKKEFWQDQLGEMPSDYAIAKDILCDRFAEMETGEKSDYSNVLSKPTNMTIDYSIKNFNQELDKSSSYILPKNKIIQETELPYREEVNINKPKKSSFYNNAMSSNALTKEAKRKISKNPNARFYKEITNEETFYKASDKLNSLGDNALSEFNSIESKNATAEDVAFGIQLMKKYQDRGDYATEAQIAGKLREIGTKSGQSVQAFSILQRMSPEGLLVYTQRQIKNAKDEILKNKSQSWINKNQKIIDNLNLTQEETQKIVENMKKVNNTNNQRQKEILLGEIQRIITDKIPPTFGDSFKAYRRISMLFNPKTQVRNVVGNIGVVPINMMGDSTIGTLADKLISNKTGIRTTGVTNLKEYGRGFKEGAVQSFDDFRRGINTRDVNGDKFEVGNKGKSFKDSNRLGKILNKIDALTNFSLDIGDRPFFKAEFMNSLKNQMKLNNVSEPTVDMIETATKIAEQRTWQDSNKYSDTVLNIRKGLNGVNIGGVGFGDIVMPFAKTPANLTKAIVDYSPLGVVNAIVDANKLNKATSKGQNTAIMQKKLVDDISKAFMGSMLYVIGTGLAKAGITSGEADDDKDIANFKKNVLGIQPYSIRIGDKSFTYNWAQPLAAPIGITANLTKKNKDESAVQSIFNAISQGGNMIYEQSFLQNLKKLLDGDDIVKGAIEAIADIPASLIPTFIKQIAEAVDQTARTTYEYNNISKTALNKVIAKVPFASKMLQPATDTMGRTIMKNGAEEGKFPNLFNIFLNPATTAKRKENKSAEEIYRLYKETGDKTVFPRVVSYYETLNKEKVILTPEQKTQIQKDSGIEANTLVTETINLNEYKKLSNEEKVKVINDLVDYSFGKATNKVINKELNPENKMIQKYVDNGLTPSNAVIFRNTINNIEGKKGIDGKSIEGSSSGQKALAIMNMTIPTGQKNKMLSLMTTSKNPETVDTLSRIKKTEKAYTEYFALNKSDTFFKTKISRDDMQDIQELKINQDEFMKFTQNIGNIKGQKDKNGKTISGSKKKEVVQYINSLNLSSVEKAILVAKAGYAEKSYKQSIYNYINSLDLSAKRKKEIWDSLGY